MGNKIKLKRKELEMTIYDLAKETNLSATYISNLENENKTNPSIKVMKDISKALQSTVPEIFF